MVGHTYSQRKITRSFVDCEMSSQTAMVISSPENVLVYSVGCSREDLTSCSTPSVRSAKWCGLHLAGSQLWPQPMAMAKEEAISGLLRRYIRYISKHGNAK